MESKIISDILNSFMTTRKQNGETTLDYVFSPFTMGLEETNADSLMRMQSSTQDFINAALNDRRIKGIVKTSQSDYIALAEVDSVSFTWSVVLYAPADTDEPMQDYKALIKEYNGKTFTTSDGQKKVQFTFVMPNKFDLLQYGNGREYSQYVMGGKACITDKSEMSSEMQIKFYTKDDDGNLGVIDVAGLLAYSTAYNPSGENSLTIGSQVANASVTSYSNAISISLHVIEDSTLAQIIKRASIGGDLGAYTIEIYQSINNGEAQRLIGEFSRCRFNSAQIRGSAGSYLLADAVLIRG